MYLHNMDQLSKGTMCSRPSKRRPWSTVETGKCSYLVGKYSQHMEVIFDNNNRDLFGTEKISQPYADGKYIEVVSLE